MGDIFLKLLNMSITAGWLILAVLCIRLLFRKIPKWVNCLLWGVVAIRLICPFSIESPFSILPSTEPIKSSTVVEGEVQNYIPSIDSRLTIVKNTINPMLTETFAYNESDSVAPLQAVTYAAGLIWCCGMVLLIICALGSAVKLHKLVREAVCVRDNIYICDAVKSPFIMGIFRPRVYLSSALCEREMDYILAHESAHLKRKDHWWKALGYLLLCIHWFNPLCCTEAYQYHQVGTPVIQPLYYNYPWIYDDTLYRNQYYFGSQLMASPILDKKDTVMNRTVHRFFIPDGIWYDFTTGKKFPGAKKYVSFFRDEDYPIFAHAGSIIPLSNRSDRNNTGLATDMEIHIFPGVSNTYTLYDDDGITSLYKEGYFLKTSIDYNYLRNNYTVIIRSIEGKSGIVPEKRNYKLVFRNTREADDVSAFHNATPLNIRKGIDGNDFVVEVLDAPTIGQVTVNCKGRDIEIDAVRVINDDIDSILMDLQINTYLKEEIASIIFGEEPIKKKRIEIRKLKKKGLSKEYMSLFLKLLEYIAEV